MPRRRVRPRGELMALEQPQVARHAQARAFLHPAPMLTHRGCSGRGPLVRAAPGRSDEVIEVGIAHGGVRWTRAACSTRSRGSAAPAAAVRTMPTTPHAPPGQDRLHGLRCTMWRLRALEPLEAGQGPARRRSAQHPPAPPRARRSRASSPAEVSMVPSAAALSVPGARRAAHAPARCRLHAGDAGRSGAGGRGGAAQRVHDGGCRHPREGEGIKIRQDLALWQRSVSPARCQPRRPRSSASEVVAARPACRRIAMPRPPKPAPTIATSVSAGSGTPGHASRPIRRGQAEASLVGRSGEVTERLKVHDWKSCGRVKLPRGFESLPLR